MFTNERGGRGSVGDVGYREGGVGGFDVGAIQLKACDVDDDGKVPPDSTTPVMKVLLKPGTMSEATGTGNLHVTLTVPRMHVAAGKPLFVLGWMAPGMSQPQPVVNLTVADTQGAVPLNMSTEGEAGMETDPGGGRRCAGQLPAAHRQPARGYHAQQPAH